jgi:predicted RNA binding protein YcfA (HicA-like mRNA interferase family)
VKKCLPFDYLSRLIYHESVSGKDVVKRLEQQGWRLDRVRGSHHVLKKDGKSCPVPVHGNKDLPTGTLKNIERITGVKLK